ncbi:hypothetical protein AURDEDRAFT_163608 [Auricularia subglabra TFB-10046 SS5]|nr:hypothetical protein AURDEDRAFT_163608 [Auricularia subglabra TFB-10046 SS5]
MFPSPPTDAAADASFGDITAKSPIRPDASTQGDELDEEAEAQQLFGPADPDERQVAVMLLQMQLAALEGVREERDALQAEHEELLLRPRARCVALDRAEPLSARVKEILRKRDGQSHSKTLDGDPNVRDLTKDVSTIDSNSRSLWLTW